MNIFSYVTIYWFAIVPVINIDRTSNKTADDTAEKWDKKDKLVKVLKRKTSLIKTNRIRPWTNNKENKKARFNQQR